MKDKYHIEVERCPKCKRPNNMGNSPSPEECNETDDEEGVCEAYTKMYKLIEAGNLMAEGILYTGKSSFSGFLIRIQGMKMWKDALNG